MRLFPSLFYGWIVTACAFCVLFLTYGVQYSFGVFLPAMLDDLGWQRASIAGACSLYTMMYSACSLIAMQIILHGWVLTEQGQEEEGITRIEEGLAIWRETRAELFLPYYHALLAEAYGRVGREAEGIALLDEALARVHNSEERWWEAELYRLKGELLLKSCVKRERKSL